ncbi:unnamed protein product [Ranitomeya imitator]|uniref:MnmE helical domain-containing protein n=1 Tax=Ranitomeya imitator TaxID=111125 RepID=A0ABN9KPC3_9NEOB|nr:unnamed protein product [Ranitomeya imitator]
MTRHDQTPGMRVLWRTENELGSMQPAVDEVVEKLQKELEEHLGDNRRGERLRDGVQVVLTGATNAGKSSLLNEISAATVCRINTTWLAGKKRYSKQCSLASGAEDGSHRSRLLCRRSAQAEKNDESYVQVRTMRDIHSPLLSIFHGFSFSSCSETTLHWAYKLAFLFFLFRVGEADILVAVIDVSTGLLSREELLAHLQNLCSSLQGDGPRNVIVALNKVDLLSQESIYTMQKLCQESGLPPVCLLSCHTKEGICKFLRILRDRLEAICGDPLQGAPTITQTRHRHHLTACLDALGRYSVHRQEDLVLSAEELRIAHRQLGAITGRVSAEDILDIIFSDFCIGNASGRGTDASSEMRRTTGAADAFFQRIRCPIVRCGEVGEEFRPRMRSRKWWTIGSKKLYM